MAPGERVARSFVALETTKLYSYPDIFLLVKEKAAFLVGERLLRVYRSTKSYYATTTSQ